MTKPMTAIDTVRLIFLWLSPLIFLKGLFLIVSTTKAYNDLERKLNKEIGGIRKKVIPRMETNISSVHEWLLKRKRAVGLFCVICSMLMFLFLK